MPTSHRAILRDELKMFAQVSTPKCPCLPGPDTRSGSVKGSNSGKNGKLWIEIFHATVARIGARGVPLASVYLLWVFIPELKRIPEANDRCGGMC